MTMHHAHHMENDAKSNCVCPFLLARLQCPTSSSAIIGLHIERGGGYGLVGAHGIASCTYVARNRDDRHLKGLSIPRGRSGAIVASLLLPLAAARRLRRVTPGPLLQQSRLLEHRAFRGASGRVAPLDSRLKIPYLHHIVCEEGMERLQVCEGEVSKCASALLGHLHSAPRDVVRLAERHALPYEILGEISRQHEAIECRLHALRLRRERGEDAVGNLEGGLGGVEGVEERLFVFLHVLVVSRRQPLECRQETHCVSDRAASLAAQQLKRVRVLLLRHQRGAGGVGVAEADEPKFLRGEDDQVLAVLGEVDHQQRAPERQLDHKVAVGHAVDRV
mmetsp:Transcript_38693/g.102048  ORF Transcript_38693/g.102048 Transcript_38693/m.102048 type:complete len:334 (+) Transcript_38693:97-1098(+)